MESSFRRSLCTSPFLHCIGLQPSHRISCTWHNCTPTQIFAFTVSNPGETFTFPSHPGRFLRLTRLSTACRTMDFPKRTCSPAESERCTKMAKISHESDNAVAETPLAQQHSDEVHVTVKLRSASKAAWHGPKPPGFWEELRARVIAGGRPSTSSEDGRATSCPTHPPTPAPPRSFTLSGRPAPSTSVDDLHPPGDGPVVGYAEQSSSGHSM